MSNPLFTSLPLSTSQLSCLDSLGYHQMTAIQEKALPPGLAGKDLIAQAKTGSGKTAAFSLPLIAKLNPRDFGAQALILCPTRELASQVADEIRRLARHQQNIKIVTLCGGQSIGPQIGSLEHGAHIIVGTPGRIQDHLRKKTLDISRINTLVLDEADRMLDMGFIADIESIISMTPPTRQTLLFSATFQDDILAVSSNIQKSPERITVESLHEHSDIEQIFYICDKRNKNDSLLALLHHHELVSAVIFCNTKQETRDVSHFLNGAGVVAKALHGDLEQRDRDQILVQFKQQSCNVLVATDVAARGLDIDNLPAVVNYDLPRETENYIHRIGRTGRAGKKGLALSIFTRSEQYKLDKLGEHFQIAIDVQDIETLAQNEGAISPPPYVSLCIAGGRKQKIRPGDILGALTGDAGIAGDAVGNIAVKDFASYVAIERVQADRALGRLIKGKIKGRRLKVRKL